MLLLTLLLCWPFLNPRLVVVAAAAFLFGPSRLLALLPTSRPVICCSLPKLGSGVGFREFEPLLELRVNYFFSDFVVLLSTETREFCSVFKFMTSFMMTRSGDIEFCL